LFATGKHYQQIRKATGLPYIVHPLEVMTILQTSGIIDEEVLAAAVLHDTVEDTDTTIQDLEKLFGARVASLVEEVTDDKSLPPDEIKRAQLLHAPHLTEGAKLIKTADKLANVQDFMRLPPPGYTFERITGYFAHAYGVVERMMGLNSRLDSKSSEVFSSLFLFQGKLHAVLQPNIHSVLKSYLDSLKPKSVEDAGHPQGSSSPTDYEATTV